MTHNDIERLAALVVRVDGNAGDAWESLEDKKRGLCVASCALLKIKNYRTNDFVADDGDGQEARSRQVAPD